MAALAEAGAAIGAATIGAGGWLYEALSPRAKLFGPTVIAGADAAEWALTYDDGPNIAATPQLLDVLAWNNVRATFFMIGEYVRQQPELARRVAAEGHIIGDHTMTHPCLAWQSAVRVRREMTDCKARIEDTLGAPVRLFRPPFGARRPVVFRVAQELGLKVVQWNALGYDWKPRSAEAIAASVERGLKGNRRRRRGSNILLHDGGHLSMGQPRLPTVAATERIIATGQREGCRFVTADAWAQ